MSERAREGYEGGGKGSDGVRGGGWVRGAMQALGKGSGGGGAGGRECAGLN
jgi:hypothetical protein